MANQILPLESRVAVVTGSGRGIGRATALRLAKLGADVVISDIRIDSAKEFHEEVTAATVMDEVKILGRRCIGIEADVTDKRSVESMFKKILDEFGRVDILVNNVGGSQAKTGPLSGESTSVSEEDMLFVMYVNLMSTIFCCQAAIPAMIAQKWGRIVNISSRCGLAVIIGREETSDATRSIYGPAKAGVIQYTRALAAELGPHGINVNCIAPGTIETARTATFIRKGLLDQSLAWKPSALGKPGTPEDIAKVVQFLVTDLSDLVTGQVVRVDGGQTLF